ncbi:uncharacterized protein [Misgurnus anguillicaudatus]|uniref:uncharacterized protein n=1 Tax=Misgurnus anguillicaudatus TaxID=75329 RepID=UPI003CCF8ECB
MGCTRKQVEQRTEPVLSTDPGETEEEQEPESPHSVQNLQAQHATPSKPSEHRRVLWPAANKEAEWQQFDEDVEATLEASCRGEVDQRLQLMSTLIITIGAERFGIKVPKAQNIARPNRRETKISQLRKELKALNRQYKRASEEEKPALTELRDILRQKLISLRRAERHRRRGRERARKRMAFIANPFSFVKQLLGQKRSGTLQCPKEEVNQYLSDKYSDSRREENLPTCRELPTPPEPSFQFNIKEPTLAEVRDIVRTARTSAAPGPTDAYGSIPHKLVTTALSIHHIPEKITELIRDYYSSFSLRFTSGTVTSAGHRLEKGIITGCTISVVLFSLAMSMLVKAAEVECRGPLSRSGIRQPPIRAYMDDLTVTSTSVAGCRWLLRGLERITAWARMMFKPAKSRSLVLRKGRVEDKHRFYVDGVIIPTVSEKPVKSLGKIFDSTLKDKVAVEAAHRELKSWLSAVDKSGLPGKFKAWIYQHGILPRLLWPLLIYEVPVSLVEGFERNISQYLRRWLGLPKSLSSIALYGHNNRLQLPFTGLTEEFKVTRAREVLLYRDSADNRVATAGITVRTGRKWRVQEAVDQAEARLRHSVLVGSVAVGRAGLGSHTRPRYDKAQGTERRQMVQREIRAEVEEERLSKTVAMRQQGAWVNWDHAAVRRITWTELWKSEPARLKFLIQSVYDVLPSPSNLHTWGLAETPACPLCPALGSLEHILSCCPKALGEGRYTWRHNQVLKVVADTIFTAIQESKHLVPVKHNISFVRAGEKPQGVRKASTGLLATARDWKLHADLGRQLKFPEHIARTSQRPDLVLTSDSTKQVVLMELTVPWEDRMEEAFERKKAKYLELVQACRESGWRARCEPIEVGCRGFLSQSVHRAFRLLGIRGLHERRATKNISEAAEKASRWLWIKRGEVWSSTLLGHKPGPDQPWLGRPGEGV